jgi:hypothetical protein
VTPKVDPVPAAPAAPVSIPVATTTYGEPTMASLAAAAAAASSSSAPGASGGATITSATYTPGQSTATAVALNTTANSSDPNAPAGGGGGGYGRGRGGFRNQRTFNGPGSASDVVVGKLAPGIAQPKVFHQALPEKPANPAEGAFALFTQALFGSAEFRYLQ